MDAEESHLNVTVQPGGECLLMSKTAAGSRDKHVVRLLRKAWVERLRLTVIFYEKNTRKVLIIGTCHKEI